MSVQRIEVHICDRCRNAFETSAPSGFNRPRTMKADIKIYVGGGGSWLSDNVKGYCEPCTELIEDVLKPDPVAEKDRILPEDLIKQRRIAKELRDRVEAEQKKKREERYISQLRG